MSKLEVKQVEDLKKFATIQKAAHEDGHSILYATHYIEQEDEIIGAFSVISPTVYWWMHTEKVKGRDSYKIGKFMSEILTESGSGIHYAPIQPDSPYYPLMEKLGYKSIGNWEIFYKMT